MSTIGSGIFFDGFSNARRVVAVALGTNAVEITAPAGSVLRGMAVFRDRSTDNAGGRVAPRAGEQQRYGST